MTSPGWCLSVHLDGFTITACGLDEGHRLPHRLGKVEWWDDGRPARRTVDGDLVGVGHRPAARTPSTPRTSVGVAGDILDRQADDAPAPGGGWPAALEGTERAATRWTDDEKALVLAAVRQVCSSQDTFTSDAVWTALDGRVQVTKGLTGVLMRAKGLGWCEQTNETTIARRGGQHDHAQRLMVWRSLLRAGGSPPG